MIFVISCEEKFWIVGSLFCVILITLEHMGVTPRRWWLVCHILAHRAVFRATFAHLTNPFPFTSHFQVFCSTSSIPYPATALRVWKFAGAHFCNKGECRELSHLALVIGSVIRAQPFGISYWLSRECRSRTVIINYGSNDHLMPKPLLQLWLQSSSQLSLSHQLN